MIKIRKAVPKDFEEIYKLEGEFMDYNNRIESNEVLCYKLNKKRLIPFKFIKKI